MNMRILPRTRVSWFALIITISPAAPLSAEEFGRISYHVINGTEIEITHYSDDADGSLEIPAEIGGMPVTSIDEYAFWKCRKLSAITIPASVTAIGSYAFESCEGLTEITIPSSVGSIGSGAFLHCTGLEAIHVQQGSSRYSSAGGVLFNLDQTTLIACPPGLAGAYSVPPGVTSIAGRAFSHCPGLTDITIPASVTSIGRSAFYECTALVDITAPPGLTIIEPYTFYGCSGLTRFTIPEGVTSIGWGAFSYCSALRSITIPSSVGLIGMGAFSECGMLASAIMSGAAPTLENVVFRSADPAFTVYYRSTATGFSSPTWEGYPSRMIDEAVYPVAAWLLSHSLPHDTDLHQDLNNDGVELLMAYALNLDPHHARPGLPRAFRSPGGISMTYYASAPGITYTVQTSTDLTAWSTSGVTVSDPDAEGFCTATIDTTAPVRLMRVMAED